MCAFSKSPPPPPPPPQLPNPDDQEIDNAASEEARLRARRRSIAATVLNTGANDNVSLGRKVLLGV